MAIDFKNAYATGTFNLVTGTVVIQYITGKVNDTGAGIFIEMKNASNVVVPPSVETMILYATRPDGTKVYFVAEYDGNRMRIDFNNSLYEVSGNVIAEIELIDMNGLKKKSNTFTINALESVFDASYVRSTDDFRVLKDALDDVKYVESELRNITPEQINHVTTAEQSRVVAEQGRVSAEQGRVSAENNRVATLNAKADLTYVNAQLNDKVQNFKIKNEIVNGDFSTSQLLWTPFNASATISDGTLKITGNGKDIVPRVKSANLGTGLNGTKFYLRVKWKINNTVAIMVDFDIRSTDDSKISNRIRNNPPYVVGELKTSSDVLTCNNVTGLNNIISAAHVYANAATANGKVLEIDDVLLVNLKNVFGAGNEPTKNEMDELMKVIPNGWWNGEITLTQKQVITWQLNLIRKNTNAIIALGGTII